MTITFELQMDPEFVRDSFAELYDKPIKTEFSKRELKMFYNWMTKFTHKLSKHAYTRADMYMNQTAFRP